MMEIEGFYLYLICQTSQNAYKNAMTPQELVDIAKQMKPHDLERLLARAYNTPLSAKRREQVYDFCATGEGKLPLSSVDVAEAVERKLKEYEATTQLTGEFVRQLIVDILQLCPTDYFAIAEDGDWCIDPCEFAKLPHCVKRLVESVEMKWVRGTRVYKVCFISKTAALALAVKLTSVQKHELHVVQPVPWDEIQGVPHDPVADRLRIA